MSTSSPLPPQDTAGPHLRNRRAPGGSAGTRAGAGYPPGAAASGCWRSGPSYGNRLPLPSPRPGTPCCRGSTGARPHSTAAEPGQAEPSRAKTGSAQLRPTSSASASQRRASAPRLPRAPRSPWGGAGCPPAPPLPPLWRPPAPSASLTGRQWRRRRAVRMRTENRRGRSRVAAAERR